MIYLFIAISFFQSIQENYYSERSFQIAQIQVDTLSFEGDSLYWAKNWIASANYKHERCGKAYEIINDINLDNVDSDKLRYSILSFKGLTSKCVNKFDKAISFYQQSIQEIPDKYPSILYRVHLNYAELLRLQMDYQKREIHLLKALAYADGEEYNKTIRVLARHYFNIELDFESAEQMLESHEEFEYLSTESKAGYRLVQAQLLEAKKSYGKAKEYYEKANRIARQAKFVSFQYDAVDGAMRTASLLDREQQRDWQWYLFNGLFIAIIVLVGGWNWYLKRQTPNRSV